MSSNERRAFSSTAIQNGATWSPWLSSASRTARCSSLATARCSRASTLAPCFVQATSASPREQAAPPLMLAAETNADASRSPPRPPRSSRSQIKSTSSGAQEVAVVIRDTPVSAGYILLRKNSPNGRHRGTQEENRCTRKASPYRLRRIQSRQRRSPERSSLFLSTRCQIFPLTTYRQGGTNLVVNAAFWRRARLEVPINRRQVQF